ncbi:MAG: PAS domain S-box protein [Chlorobi bacterium]|nr:PAS domain S-box protein [Chlorobiota bacterium]
MGKGKEMSINDFRDSIIGKPHSRKPSNYPDSDMGTSQSDKSLIMGTTRFYEEILLSIHNSLVIVYNSEGKHIEVWGNAQTEEQYGIESKSLKGKSIEGFFQEPEAKEIHNQVQRVFKENKALNFKVNIKFPSGDFWFEVNLSPMKETQGKPKTVIGHFYDISDMVAKEKKLLSINEKLSYIIDHAPDGMISTNSKGVVISVNKTLTDSSHFQKEDFLGKKFHKLPIFLQGDYEKYQSITEMFLSGQIPEPFEIEWKTKDGKTKWGEVRSGIISKKGKFAGFQLAISDITERKEIENDLFKSKQAYKIIVENAHEAIYILQDYHIRFCNARTLELANCSMDELLTTSIMDLIHPDDREIAKRRIADRTDGKRKQDRFVYRILDKEGNLKWLENNTILIDWHGKPAILVFATDITDTKTAKDKEKKYLKSLEFLSEKAMEFIEIKADVDIYPILGEKIREIEPDSCILLLSHNYQKNITQIVHFLRCIYACDNR